MIARAINTLTIGFNGLLDIFYPRLCGACGNVLQSSEDHICFYCYPQLPVTNFHKSPQNPVEKAFWGRFPIEKATAYLFFSKGGRTQNIIHNVKYQQQYNLGHYIGRCFATELRDSEFLKDIDLIIPIPLSLKKLKKRGYNQSTSFGLGFSETSGIPLNDQALIRNTHTTTQTLKGRFGRWENVSSIFSVINQEAIANRHILVFDDVITTGSTLEAAARALSAVEGVKISIATIGVASRLP